MKKRRLAQLIRPNGVLRWSTLCLFGSLLSCDRDSHTMSEQDAKMIDAELQLSKLDTAKSQLLAGEVKHNFYLEKVGYYHADAFAFFPHPYGYTQDAKYFMNGEWKEELLPAVATASRPSPDALEQVQKALEEEQKTAGNSSQGGFGMSNALMMYWLLSGNRGFFSPGAGFHRASGQAMTWQQKANEKRQEVRSYGAANPGYRKMAEQSLATGKSVQPGQSVRGGFGSSSMRSQSTSFGS